MSAPDIKLITLFSAISATLLIRILAEQTGYCSPDSFYYLDAAQHLIDGQGYYLSISSELPRAQATEINNYLTTWPAGYPLLIAGIAFIFSLPVFWASKILNILFLGLCFLLLRKIQKDQAYLLGLFFCSFTFLEIFSYTWSEGPFLFGLLWFVYALFNYFQQQFKISYLLQLFCSALLLFLTRYIGIFSFILIAFFSGFLFIKKRYRPALNLLLLLLILSSLASLYLYNNYLQTGRIVGGGRLDADSEGAGLFLWHLFTGLTNELLIIRKYYWQGKPDLIFVATLLFQIIMLLLVYYKYLKDNISIPKPRNSLVFLFIAVAFTYLFSIILLRILSPTYPFDYRILSPYSFCMYMATLLYLTQSVPTVTRKNAYQYIIVLFSVSLALNLPKEYLIRYGQSLLQQLISS